MRKLLSANFARLWKNKAFWATVISLAVLSLAAVWLDFSPDHLNGDTIFYVEDVMFNLLPIIAFVNAGFISIFLGTECDEHTIRNKLVVGHTRSDVYFANSLSCFVASTIQMVVVLLISGIAGWILYGVFRLPLSQLLWILLSCIMVCAVYSAIFAGISMNISSKSSSLVATLLLALGLFLMISYLYGNVTVSVNGVAHVYNEGKLPDIMKFLCNLLPTGQVMLINNMDLENYLIWPLCSVILLIPTLFVGYIPFRKRDIR